MLALLLRAGIIMGVWPYLLQAYLKPASSEKASKNNEQNGQRCWHLMAFNNERHPTFSSVFYACDNSGFEKPCRSSWLLDLRCWSSLVSEVCTETGSILFAHTVSFSRSSKEQTLEKHLISELANTRPSGPHFQSGTWSISSRITVGD